MTPTSEITSPRRTLKSVLFTGILFLVPIGITWWLVDILVTNIEGYARPLVEQTVHAFGFEGNVPHWLLTIISLTVVFLFVLLIGWLASFYFGKQLLRLVDKLLLRVPLVRTIYGGTKQITEAFSLQRSSGSFKKVVLLEYPRKGCWVLGFITSEDYQRIENLFDRNLTAVFVPSTPNPTTGFLLYLEPSELYLIDLGVEEAVKLIVSAGMVMPQKQKNAPISMDKTSTSASEENGAAT